MVLSVKRFTGWEDCKLFLPGNCGVYHGNMIVIAVFRSEGRLSITSIETVYSIPLPKKTRIQYVMRPSIFIAESSVVHAKQIIVASSRVEIHGIFCCAKFGGDGVKEGITTKTVKQRLKAFGFTKSTGVVRKVTGTGKQTKSQEKK